MLQHVTQFTSISHGCPINYNLCLEDINWSFLLLFAPGLEAKIDLLIRDCPVSLDFDNDSVSVVADTNSPPN